MMTRWLFSGLWLTLLITLTSCSDITQPNTFFPLGKNLSWQYQASHKAGRESNKHKIVIDNLNPVTIDGEDVIPRQFQNNAIAYYKATDSGIRRVASQASNGEIIKDEDAHFLIKSPFIEGTRWQLPSQPFHLKKMVREINAGQASLSGDLKINPLILEYQIASTNESVKVAAGTFHQCLKVTGKGSTTGKGAEIGTVSIDVQHTDWYAPGVGLVKTTRIEKTNLSWAEESLYQMELEHRYP